MGVKTLSLWALWALWALSAQGRAGDLHEAAYAGRGGEVQRLLARGADVNSADDYGFTPLLLAEIGGRRQTATLLRARGAELGLEPLLLRLETALAFLGYDPGAVDGRAAIATRQAIRAFQRDENLPVSGRIAPAWVRRLQRKLMFRIQTALAARGWYEGAPHGIFDAATAAGLRAAGAEFGLAVGDYPSAALLARLDPQTSPAAAPPRPQPDPETLLRRVQTRLQQLNYAPGAVDGRLGRNTRRAITRFQRRAGLTVTGEPSAGLLSALEAADAPAAAARPTANANTEVSGPLRFERDADGTLLGCAIGTLQIDRPWCLPFADDRDTERCKAIIRPDSTLLMVRC